MITINRYLLCLSLFINYILYYLKKISFSKILIEVLNIKYRVMLQTQTILKYFYKLLIWYIFTSSNMDPSLTSHFYLQ